jgi:SMC interacting uncharacterized protein involved in chromosome segregation
MNIIIQNKLRENPKMLDYLKENSYWYKELNRNSNSYNNFINFIKEKYKLRSTDKVETFLSNIDLVSNVLEVLK